MKKIKLISRSHKEELIENLKLNYYNNKEHYDSKLYLNKS